MSDDSDLMADMIFRRMLILESIQEIKMGATDFFTGFDATSAEDFVWVGSSRSGGIFYVVN